VLLVVAPDGPIGVIGWVTLAVNAVLLVAIVAWKNAPFLVTIAVAAVSVLALVARGNALVP
jgi:hypothetical protein